MPPAARTPTPEFWRGKRVLLTGHTGFKGAWTALWLARMGARVTGFALDPAEGASLYALADVARDCASRRADLRDPAAVAAIVAEADPEIVLHMAAQALVVPSLEDPAATFAVNAQGTAHLLDALRGAPSLRAVLVVTSDKVYWNDGSGRPLREEDPLGGRDPYSASKAAAEHVARAYAASYFEAKGVRLATARGGNVIGGGDFAPYRITPDCVRAARRGEAVVLRHPEATRPWQHVLDCVAGYLLHIEALAADAACPRALNFGPRDTDDLPVRVFAETLLKTLGAVGSDGAPMIDEQPVPGSVEAPRLQIDAARARARLGWEDRLPGRAAIAQTAAWYRAWAEGADMRARTLLEIDAATACDAHRLAP